MLDLQILFFAIYDNFPKKKLQNYGGIIVFFPANETPWAWDP